MATTSAKADLCKERPIATCFRIAIPPQPRIQATAPGRASQFPDLILALGLKAQCPLERWIVDLCSEIPRADARVVFLVQTGAITDQECGSSGLISTHAIHLISLAVGVIALE